jgi:hypothetical protein
MLFSKAQQHVMNLAANSLSTVKEQQEKYKAIDGGGYDEQEVMYVLSDGVAIHVKIEVRTIVAVTE